MADYPIIFSAPMIRAILAGRKSQTRRVLKPQPQVPFKNGQWYRPFPNKPAEWHYIGRDHLIYSYYTSRYQPGDRLWVREAWQAFAAYDNLSPKDIPVGSDILYLADREDSPWDARRRHARFMCRWMSRLTLTVTEVRVQRLQDISEEDSIAEGIDDRDPVCGFSELWDSLHGPGSWAATPWVAAISFETRMGNIDG